MDHKEIQELIKLVKKNKISELEIERKDFKIVIRSNNNEKQSYQQVIQAQPPVMQQPVAQQAASPAIQAETAEAPVADESSNYVEFKSPMIGTFYRSPGPDKDPFMSIGDKVTKGQTVCMIEAMKLFNEIEAEFEGKLVKILVEDATPVEFDQPLFLIDPKG